MQYAGIILGLITFAMIGVLHVAVVKIEHIWGSGLWPVFIVLGVILAVGSLFVDDVFISCLLGVNGFMFAWSGPELKKQKERAKGTHSH